MKCDSCGKDIKGSMTTTKSGEKWCYTCTKKAKYPANPKRAKTKDPFVRLVRKLRGISSKDTGFSTVFMKCGSKRAYTNGQVLLGEVVKRPKQYKLIDTDNLWELAKGERFTYPSIEHVIKTDSAMLDAVIIPEDFYTLANAFNEPKPKAGEVRVCIRGDGIVIKDRRDDSALVYGEFVAPLTNEADFDFAYFMVLKPREIIVDAENGPAHVKNSYVEGMENCVVVLIMPMKKSD